METSDEVRGAGSPLLRIDPDVTELTRLGRSTIYREVSSGRLRAVRVGRAVRVRRDDLEKWLAQHSHGGESAQAKSADPSDGAAQ
jgi:excisionase family DNA binding protein